jgi:hypothetical protein
MADIGNASNPSMGPTATDLRSTSGARHMMEGSLVGRARWVFLAAALAALGIAGTAVPAAIGAAPSEPSQDSESSSAVISWPGARGGPAGIRAWTPGTGSSWMHRVPEDGSPVSLTFGTLPPDAYSLPVADALDMAGIDVGGPHADQPERVADVRVQAWLMDLDGQTVVIHDQVPAGHTAGPRR